MSRLPTLTTLLLVACSDGPAPADVADSSNDTTDAVDTLDASDTRDTTDAGDTLEPGVPILERAGRTDFVCSEALAPVGSTGPSWYPLTLAAVGDRAWLVRNESGVKLSTIGTDGTLGPSIDLGGPAWGIPGAAMAERDGVLTIVWREQLDQGGEQLRRALVTTAGEVTAAPANLPATRDQEAATPHLGATATGHRLVWSSGDSAGRHVIRHARLDNGALGEVMTLADAGSAYGAAVLGLADDADGFAVAWSAPNAGFASEVWFQTFDGDGNARHPARRISRQGQEGLSSGAYYGAGAASPLLRVGDRYLVAFTEDHQPPGFTELGYATLQIAVVDASGEGSLTPLAAPADGRIATAASFYAFGDALGLYWAEGTIIRICGGCYVDYVLRTLLLDPASLTPVSAPATHTAQDHGFNAPEVAVLGSDVLSVSLQDFHALTRPASAVMRCVPFE